MSLAELGNIGGEIIIEYTFGVLRQRLQYLGHSPASVQQVRCKAQTAIRAVDDDALAGMVPGQHRSEVLYRLFFRDVDDRHNQMITLPACPG